MADICVVFLKSNFWLRLSFFMAANLIGIVPLLVLRPYKDLAMNLLEILTETSFFVITGLILLSGGGSYGNIETLIMLVSLSTGMLVQAILVV